MVAAICGFDQTWESYKKKYKVVYTKYKNDKKVNEISSTDRHQECKCFDQLDVWNSTHACVKNHNPANATKGEGEIQEDKGSPELQEPKVIPKHEKKKLVFN
jgi:hypothetical protein